MRRCRSSAPAGATLAVAGLATQCNGSCSLPQYIAAAVVKGGRVYVALVDAALPAPTQAAAPPGACDAVWKDFYDRYKAAYAAYEAAKESSKAYELLQAASHIETEGGAAVDECRKSRTQEMARAMQRFPASRAGRRSSQMALPRVDLRRIGRTKTTCHKWCSGAVEA